MNTVYEIIEKLGGQAAIGRFANIGPSTVGCWKANGSIPVRYWPVVIKYAGEQGARLDAEAMLRAHIASFNERTGNGDSKD